jgi:hypothetical protein
MMFTTAPVHGAEEERDRRSARAVEQTPAIASFEGRPIDLTGDWGEARACLVWREGGVLECFRTPQALEAREAQLAPRRDAGPGVESSTGIQSGYAAYSYSCSSSLRLFDYSWYGGRQLSFWDRGYWQNLWDYGFDNRTSSYIVGGCGTHLAEHPNGGGWWYPGPTYPYAGEPTMPWWSNVISSIYIQ